jgi:hypothetical protein
MAAINISKDRRPVFGSKLYKVNDGVNPYLVTLALIMGRHFLEPLAGLTITRVSQ